MARVNVFLDDRLLEAIDQEASRSNMKRSQLVQEALRGFLDVRRRAAEEEEARKRMTEACAVMDTVAEKLGGWDPVSVIREFRERTGDGEATGLPKRRSARRS